MHLVRYIKGVHTDAEKRHRYALFMINRVWEIWQEIEMLTFQINVRYGIFVHFIWNYSEVLVTEPHWCYFNIDSGYGFVPSAMYYLNQCWLGYVLISGLNKPQGVQVTFFCRNGWIYKLNLKQIRYINHIKVHGRVICTTTLMCIFAVLKIFA